MPVLRCAGGRGLKAEGTIRYELPPGRAEPTSGLGSWSWSPAGFAPGSRSGSTSSGGPEALRGRIRALLLLLGPIAIRSQLPTCVGAELNGSMLLRFRALLATGENKGHFDGGGRAGQQSGFYYS